MPEKRLTLEQYGNLEEFMGCDCELCNVFVTVAAHIMVNKNFLLEEDVPKDAPFFDSATKAISGGLDVIRHVLLIHFDGDDELVEYILKKENEVVVFVVDEDIPF